MKVIKPMQMQAANLVMTYDKWSSGQKLMAVRIGDVKYLAKLSERIAKLDGFNKKTTTHAKIKAGIGPKKLRKT